MMFRCCIRIGDVASCRSRFIGGNLTGVNSLLARMQTLDIGIFKLSGDGHNR